MESNLLGIYGFWGKSIHRKRHQNQLKHLPFEWWPETIIPLIKIHSKKILFTWAVTLKRAQHQSHAEEVRCVSFACALRGSARPPACAWCWGWAARCLYKQKGVYGSLPIPHVAAAAGIRTLRFSSRDKCLHPGQDPAPRAPLRLSASSPRTSEGDGSNLSLHLLWIFIIS